MCGVDRTGKPTRTGYAVAASSEWTDPDGVRRPVGEAHAWTPGTNQTLCRLALSRAVTRAVGDQVVVVVGASSGIGRAEQFVHGRVPGPSPLVDWARQS